MELEKYLKGIITDHGLRDRFPDRVAAEARHLSDGIPDTEWKRRVDLTSKRFVTIDGETARDFDDAVFVCRRGGDGWTLHVAIADVSHFVAPGTAFDQEAALRGTSVYFPGSCIPMLPERLSNDLCSLRPHEDRLVVTVEMQIDAKGDVTGTRFYRGVIRSVARLTYTEVDQAAFKKEGAARRRLHDTVDLLDEMAVLMRLLRGRRLERGSLDFDLPEPQIILNIEDGTPEAILKAPRTEAHMLIEEFMILANEQVAQFIGKRGGPMIYRVHGAPERDDLKDMAALAVSFGYSLPIHRRVGPKDLVALLRQARGRPEERLLNLVTLRSLPRAVYSTDNIGHFGLASTCYTHFTSPIRRYPDLVVHRLLSLGLDGSQRDQGVSVKQLRATARLCSEAEYEAMKTERQIVYLYQTFFMQDKIGKEFGARISGVTDFGLFVELDDFMVEGLVGKRSLKDDRYRFLPTRHALVGIKHKKRYSIGTPVRVCLRRTHLEKRHIDFELIEDYSRSLSE